MVVQFGEGNELEIRSGGFLFLKDGSGEQYKEWQNLTGSQQEQLEKLSEALQYLADSGLEIGRSMM